MKKLLTQYSAYHQWANQQLFDFILKYPKELHVQEVKGSFPCLYKTILHMWDAEAVWWQRLKLMEQIVVPSEGYSGELKDIVQAHMKQSRIWHEWIVNAQEHMFEHEFIYYSSRKEKFKQATYQVIHHVFNHGTYHRGGLVNILRQFDIQDIPQTDFIVWGRKKS